MFSSRTSLLARLLPLAVVPLAVVSLTGTAGQAAAVNGTITVGRAATAQRIDGLGFSEAFQRAAVIHGLNGLSQAKQREVVDLLFSRTRGAGASILRLGIGSSADSVYDHMPSIAPTSPGSPTAKPAYVWDRDDGGQVWLAKQARAYGVERFYADAWSAPGYMKDNGTDINGGTLCGLTGTSCATGDWRTAYANYLVQYATFYGKEGIKITDLGFTNEPNWTTGYASMRFTPAQAAEFVKVLGPIAKKAGIELACCDAVGYSSAVEYSNAITADPQAARWVSTHTGHAYGSPWVAPLPSGGKPAWMSEWGPSGSTWNESWDDGSGYDGMTIARHINDTLTLGKANGYVYWLGASVGATRSLIQLDGDAYHVSKRFWAFAAFSRFIRPDARAVTVTTDLPGLQVSAFRNVGGERVLEVLNTGTAELAATLAVGGGHGTAYRTDATHSLTVTDSVTRTGSHLTGRFPPRSLTTVVLQG
jgi:glucuronoarabinoxylan endo-1,4-beta-xylanase